MKHLLGLEVSGVQSFGLLKKKKAVVEKGLELLEVKELLWVDEILRSWEGKGCEYERLEPKSL